MTLGDPAQTVDVVVPVHGRYELTRSCLQHLAAQTVSHHVLVVDDGSCDDTVERLTAEWPAVQIVRLARQQGFSRAVNAGVAAGFADVVVLLNNDVQLAPDALERLIAPLCGEPSQIGSVASLMMQPGTGLIDSVGVAIDETLAGYPRLRGFPQNEAARVEPTLAGPEGTAGAYRRSAWEAVGGLDEHIVAYHEVVDLALRLSGAGWRCVAATGATGVHLGSATYGARPVTVRRLAGASRGYMLRRWRLPGWRAVVRATLSETLVVAADTLLNHDLASLSGRIHGWRAASGLTRHPPPSPEVIATSITLRRSFALRWAAVQLGAPTPRRMKADDSRQGESR
ncbi:MAG: glycosyltransferase family 2 protein [Actinomycetota bacterium]|nr:glycosyltransferase family 2 protein [Actinomycetota bacterium]